MSIQLSGRMLGEAENLTSCAQGCRDLTHQPILAHHLQGQLRTKSSPVRFLCLCPVCSGSKGPRCSDLMVLLCFWSQIVICAIASLTAPPTSVQSKPLQILWALLKTQ